MTKPATFGRRAFMRRGAMGAGALWALSLGELMGGQIVAAVPSPYGPISPKLDQTTGLPLIQLPEGFRYWSYSWTGDIMSDGVACPNLHDGMAVVDEWNGPESGDAKPDDRRDGGDDDRGRSRRLVLVRNHEGAGGTPYLTKPDITYEQDASGGTTNLVFDPKNGKWLQSWSSLAGTWRNCAGGGYAVGHLDHLRERQRRRPRMEFRSRRHHGRPDATQGHGPLLSRSGNGRSPDRATSTRPRTRATAASTSSCPTRAGGWQAAALST